MSTALHPSDLGFFSTLATCGSLSAAARELGVTREEPFLQMAFVALPVIPHLKITDHGMVDVDRFEVMP